GRHPRDPHRRRTDHRAPYAIDPRAPARLMDLSLTTWVLPSLCIFAAAFIRGFTGFGLAVVGVPLLALFFAPAEIVPSIMILAILAGLELLPTIWRAIALET